MKKGQVHELPSLSVLEKRGVIGQGEAHFARFCASYEPPPGRSLMELVVAIVSQHLKQGHPCVPLSVLSKYVLVAEDGEVLGSLPDKSILLQALLASACVISSGADSRGTSPLVMDAEERVYVARFFDHEQRLARGLAILQKGAEADAAHAKTNASSTLNPEWLKQRLDHYFPPQGDEEDLQRSAAAHALTSPLTVISGGPGTGKTSTVVKILALLFDEAQARGARPPLVNLLAPTGKAAARMMEAISGALAQLSIPESLLRHIGGASTIHRALGVVSDNPNRFRRGPNYPLRADVVLVDEASMVDLALMRHLVEALAPGARLILLGDRHQLASVEAGSVLAELSADTQEEKGGFTVELKKSYRFSAGSSIARFAESIRDGDGSKCRQVLNEVSAELTFKSGEPLDDADFRQLVVSRYGDALRHEAPLEVLRHMSRFRVLCAHRRGRRGVLGVNEAIYEYLVSAGRIPSGKGHKATESARQFYRGRLLLVTQNDYDLGLFNGDIGLVWPEASGRLAVYFEGQSGELRSLSPAQLPEHETAYALSIHKSQGSEHDEVAVILPDASSPLLSRQLVYTAVTRARKSVHLFGSEESVLQAASRSVTRFSGLGAALARALAPSGDGPQT